MPLRAGAVAAGTFTLEKNGDRYTLVSEGAPLSEILAEVDRMEPAALRFYGDQERAVRATFRDLPLEQLLDRLRISFLLTYEADDAGGYRLGDAIVLDSDARIDEPGSAGAIRALVRALHDDAIKWNAHEASWSLQELGCDAVPFLEEALRQDDPQGRHIAATLLRSICPEHVPSEALITATLDLLNGGEASYEGELVYPSAAYDYLNQSNIYPLVRSRLLAQLNHMDPRVRLYSSLIAANHREAAFAPGLVRTLLPHLSDNDLKGDAAAATYALRQLGAVALPQLKSARATSTDTQQKELLDQVISAIETGTSAPFAPEMYVGYVKDPANERSWLDPTRWDAADFPDAQGGYAHGGENRMTTRDYYGPWEPVPFTPSEIPVVYDASGADYEESFPYRVKEGETVDSISEKFSVRPGRLVEVNPGLDPNRPLVPGTRILVPWL